MKALLMLFGVAWACLATDAAARPYRPTDRQLIRCMGYLPAMRDVRLRRWCAKQSEWMP